MLTSDERELINQIQAVKQDLINKVIRLENKGFAVSIIDSEQIDPPFAFGLEITKTVAHRQAV